jgi:hypothetical protein
MLDFILFGVGDYELDRSKASHSLSHYQVDLTVHLIRYIYLMIRDQVHICTMYLTSTHTLR